MTNPDELERAVAKLEKRLGEPGAFRMDDEPALRLILSANREMRELLELIEAFTGRSSREREQQWPEMVAAERKAEDHDVAGHWSRLARSALTTQRGV